VPLTDPIKDTDFMMPISACTFKSLATITIGLV